MDITLRRYCKLYTLVLFVLIVEATDSSSNETSHERRQSRVTGRIVKLYSGTRPEPILCAGEGFQADPHDCAVFYRCMKSGSGKFTVFRFQCGPGTVYDPETEVCNHPRSTKRSECGGLSLPPAVDRINNNEIEGTQNEIPSPITTQPIRTESTTGARVTFTTANPWTTSSSTINTSTKRETPQVSTVFTNSYYTDHANVDYTVNPLNLPHKTVTQNQQYTKIPTYAPTTSAVPQSSSRDNICTSDGFMGDSENCRKFYRCVANQRGTYTRFEFSCSESTIWDDDTQSCNHAWAVKRSRCGRSNQDSQLTTNSEIPQKDSSTDKTIQQQLQVSYGSKVTQSQIQISNGSVIQNQTQINYGDRLNQNQGTKAKQNQTQISYGSAISQTQTQIDYSDKGVQTQLQIDHSQQSSQTQIQVHESTTVAPLSSTYPSTSDVGSQESNGCDKSGFMGDTNDCKKFYRCIDNGRGGYTKFEFSCGDGTVWDQSIEACNHAWAVKECGGKVSTETTSTTQSAISTSKSTQNYYTTVSTENYETTSELIDIEDSEDSGYGHQNQNPTTSSSITSGSTTTKSPSNENCQSSGFIGDANDCKIFYRCVENGKGSFTKYEFKCGEGTVWDQSIEACNHAWAVKECGGKVSTETTSTTQSAISISKSTQNYYTTVSTENYQTTSELIATEDNEDSGYGHQNQNPTTSSSIISSSTTSGSTTTKSPYNGNCQSSGFIGDANDCKIFYRCVENGKGSFTKYEFKCGEGTVWDPDLEACNHDWAVKKCGGNASPDINNIDTTTENQNTLSTAFPQSTTVSQSPIESAATQNDDYDNGYGSVNNDFTSTTTTTTKQPANEEHGMGNICQSSGFMGDENDCKKFYRCVDNGNGGYTRYEFTCGEGTVWDSKIEACNHAWAVEKCGGSTVDHQETTTQAKPVTTYNPQVVDSSSTESNQNTVSSTLPSSTSSTSTATESVSMGSNDCTHGGFIGDQKDCKKFYRCVDNGKGSFTKYEFSCGEGTVWDQKIEACNHAWAVETCGGTADSSTGHHETSTQFHPTMSDEIDNGYPSNIDSGSEITTQSTTTHPTTESSKEPNASNNCINSGFIGDQNDCKKFYRCVDDGNGGYIRYEFSCGEGTLWDQSIEACNHAWAVKDCGKIGNNTVHTSSESPTQVTITSENEDQGYPQSTEKTSTSAVSNYPDSATSEVCSQEGFVGDKKNCKKFNRCVDNGRGGFTKYEFTCGEGTYWSQEILSCDHASSDKTCGEKESVSSTQNSLQEYDEMPTEATSMPSSSTEKNDEYETQKPQVSTGVCTSEGFYGDRNDCKKFYRCVDNGKGSYTKYDFTCGDGTVWNQEIQACDHESSNKICSSSSPPSTSQTTENPPEAGNDISMTTAAHIQHSTEKTDTSFTPSSNQCTSEGFFAEPNDCKKFIRCVSNDKGGYTKYEFSCGEGTIWVQDILACDHDTGDTNCSAQTTNKPLTTEGHQQTTEKNEPGTSTSESYTIDKQDDEYDNGGFNKPPQSVNGECSSEGFYGNENDCRQFYRCVDNGQGGYTKYDFTCGEGTAWDSEIQACNHINQVKTCHDASETQPIMHDEDNSQTTETSSTTTSSSPTSSTMTTSTTTSGPNHDTTAENKNTCDNEGYFGDTQDCKKFYRCVDNGKGGYTKYDYTCGDGTIWDQDITTCNHPQDVVNPSCSQNQDGSTTSTTVASSSSSDSSSSTSSSSQTTTESTQSSSNCSQEETSKKPENQNITCDKAGYYANPNDCKKFYRCVDWDGDGKRFSVYHFECGEGTIWDPAVETCNHEESVYPPRDCSGSQSQSENQSPTTEGTTTTQQETSPQESTTTQTSSTPQSSTEQTTQSTTSEPTTQQSTSSEQTTIQQSTTSDQTTTQQSTSSEQTTTQQSTTSDQTTTQQSTTSEQTTTQTSTTSEQTTQTSTASEQTTQQSTTSEQTTQQSTTSEQTTTEQSTTSEQTTTQQSTTSEQTTQQSTASEQPTTEQSTTSEQTTTQQSTTSEQTTQESTTSEQTTQASTTTEQSTTSEQTTTEQSTTTESTTEQSSTTTESSSTEQSTTQQSTTTEQSEQSTTEESTSSEGTTTQQSTTEQSTTEQTNENSTTDSGTDENTSENKCPETNEDQSLFVCPTSFKRHPRYCNLFYQCDEDDDTHDVKIAIFTCPNNTIYDESETRCVEESKADKKCDGKIAQKRRFKRLDKHYKEPLVVTKESHACSSAGYFSFEKDSECSPALLKCKTDKTNKLRGLVYQCPTGYVYWSISKRCEPMNKVRDCKRSQNNWAGRWEIPVERRNVAPS